MEIAFAQSDIRRAFVGGGPGVVVSGLVWLAAALAARQSGTAIAFAVLFFGGMLIFPVGAAIVRGIFRRTGPEAGNPLGRVALESTMAMIGGLFPAYLMLSREPALVFPLAAIAVGTHYFAFGSVYGTLNYWILGAVITGLGLLDAVTLGELPFDLVLSVAVVELLAGAAFIGRQLKAERG